MDGLLRCSRYAFGPNRLHYCGPDASREIKSYIDEGKTDLGLEHFLKQFKTMYPYLCFIAKENHLRDPFDNRVVEAYWLGNNLLEKIDRRHFYLHLTEEQQIKKKLNKKDFGYLEKKLGPAAIPHHSFHVLNVWKRTGHAELEHTLESMDECRISWGKVIEVNGPTITVLTEPLLYGNGKLFLGAPVKKKLTRQLEAEYDIEQIKPGDIVSIHWSVPCEKISASQAAVLKKYTLKSIALANQTV
jgi:hypothetical protein